MELVDAPDDSLVVRAARHAALGEPSRLALATELLVTDRSPTELARRFGLSSNLLAHHLDVLEEAGLVERVDSAGDRRRRYVRADRRRLRALGVRSSQRPDRPVVFVCSRNSARSPLAAALWTVRTGALASSAGTRPADRVDPDAVAAAERAGLDLVDATPTVMTAEQHAGFVVTVCDQAHEELDAPLSWWHWSIPDPVEVGGDGAFDRAIAQLTDRIDDLHVHPPDPTESR